MKPRDTRYGKLSLEAVTIQLSFSESKMAMCVKKGIYTSLFLSNCSCYIFTPNLCIFTVKSACKMTADGVLYIKKKK